MATSLSNLVDNLTEGNHWKYCEIKWKDYDYFLEYEIKIIQTTKLMKN